MASHLTLEERDRIAQLHYQGAQQKEIARAIRRCPGTISRELRRNQTGEVYHAAQAQRESERRRRERPLVRKMEDPEINDAVRAGLAQEWAPEQIAGRMKQQDPEDCQRSVSPQTIYAWIKQDEHRKHWESLLRHRGKRPNRRKNTTSTGDAARIDHRPEAIEKRLRLGDFEGDTVLGPPGTGGLATLVDRKSRLTIVVKIQSKNADRVHEKIKQRLKQLDDHRRHSITFDNGTEFARCYRLEKHLGVKLYFADPGCPYQRGTNENTNGLIRQYFPKGTDFRNISHHEVRCVENLLNNRPRACLGFRTPAEVFFEKNPPTGCD
jgi:transposase, IS30 family